MSRKTASAVLAALMAFLIAFSVATAGAAAALEGYSVKLDAPRRYVHVGTNLQLTAEITVPEGSELKPEDFTIEWSSDNEHCSVDKKGLVHGVTPGNSIITATVTEPESGETFKGTIKIACSTAVDAANDYLRNNTVMGYRFNGSEKFYYYDQDVAWQKTTGFMNAFDYVSPYLTINYDYVRVNYNYGGKARMVQLWKGQYGIAFYGSEIGYYYRDGELKEGEEVNAFTPYKCADNDRLKMQTTLYWDKDRNGDYQYQFTVPYDDYWWCTGFRGGHLYNTEPCDELRLEGFVDFHDEEEANAVAKGLEECGFKKAESSSALELDTYAQEGNRISICWQNISEAQNTVVVKSTINALIATGSIAAVFMPLGFFFMTFITMPVIFLLMLF